MKSYLFFNNLFNEKYWLPHSDLVIPETERMDKALVIMLLEITIWGIKMDREGAFNNLKTARAAFSLQYLFCNICWMLSQNILSPCTISGYKNGEPFQIYKEK